MVGYWDQMEDILNQLKKDGNSDLFLHRVKKSEAPDYYEVIKNPMDLGTMTKKLQKGEYKSRQTFTSDLSLIFSNCRAYNTGTLFTIIILNSQSQYPIQIQWKVKTNKNDLK